MFHDARSHCITILTIKWFFVYYRKNVMRFSKIRKHVAACRNYNWTANFMHLWELLRYKTTRDAHNVKRKTYKEYRKRSTFYNIPQIYKNIDLRISQNVLDLSLLLEKIVSWSKFKLHVY